MKLSILIAAYNIEKFIKKCVESCFEKTLVDDYEIIVINDGSEDGTLDILESLRTEISNLRIITRENSGLGATRNIGIQEARGEYIWIIDGDDFVSDGFIKKLFSNFESNRDIYAININVVSSDYNLISVKYPPNFMDKIFTGKEYYHKNYQDNYTWQYIFKKNIFLNNKLFFKNRINMQDSELLPKILFHTRSVQYIDEVGYNYVQHQQSFTNTNNPEKRYFYFVSINVVKESLEDFALSIKGEDEDFYQIILLKINSLHKIVFNHLVHYRYNAYWFRKNIDFLKSKNFFPLKYKAEGKMKLVKWGINNFPMQTNFLLNFFRK